MNHSFMDYIHLMIMANSQPLKALIFLLLDIKMWLEHKVKCHPVISIQLFYYTQSIFTQSNSVNHML